MAKTIKIDGQTVAVVNELSSGPGCPTTVYEYGRPGCTGLLPRVELFCGQWTREIGYGERQVVTVEVLS